MLKTQLSMLTTERQHLFCFRMNRKFKITIYLKMKYFLTLYNVFTVTFDQLTCCIIKRHFYFNTQLYIIMSSIPAHCWSLCPELWKVVWADCILHADGSVFQWCRAQCCPQYQPDSWQDYRSVLVQTDPSLQLKMHTACRRLISNSITKCSL